MNPLRLMLVKSRCLCSLLLAPALFGSAGLRAQKLDGAQQFADLGEMTLESGQVIHGCKLGYRTVGTLNAERSNAVLFPTWFTGNSAGAMAQVSPEKLFDPAPYFVVFIDALGDGVSCSPSNSVSQHGPAFPNFTIRDMVMTEHRLATEVLGLRHVRAVMGSSMGGMQTYQWVVSYPDYMDVAIPIVGSPRLTSYDKLLWRTEEEAILRDPAYKGGNFTGTLPMPEVQLIHSMNLTTPQFRVEHTSPAEFDKFYADTEATTNGAFDANDWRWQIHAMLAQDIAPGAELATAAARIRAKMLIINGKQDHMVNPLPSIGFAPLVHAPILLLDNDCGHLSPGCALETVRPRIEAFLKSGR